MLAHAKTDKKKKDDETLDEFTRLKKLSGKQIAEIRRTIAERDELISSSAGSGGKSAVQLSSRVRELLREVHETHSKMQARCAKEEKDLAKGRRNLPYTQVFLDIFQKIAPRVKPVWHRRQACLRARKFTLRANAFAHAHTNNHFPAHAEERTTSRLTSRGDRTNLLNVHICCTHGRRTLRLTER